MGNLKCENALHVQNNVASARFASNLTAKICLLHGAIPPCLLLAI